ncbi:MAG: copper resistance protein B [Xanthomonadales bacterium]|nr:copper resistance protein B [Xanthomonadales bacterium]
MSARLVSSALALALAVAIALAVPAQAQDHAAHHDHAASGHPAHASPDPSAADHAGLRLAATDHSRMERGSAHPTGQHAGHAPHAKPAPDHSSRGLPPAMQRHGQPSALSPRPSAPTPDHVPPPPPATDLGPLSHAEMDALMGMDDNARFGRFTVEELEYVQGGAVAWSIEAWQGSDADRLHVRSEGERQDGRTGPADIEAFWSHAVAPFWNSLLGVRRDFGAGPQRTWAALGVEGIAPFWFDVDATFYIDRSGRTAFRIEAEYDLLLGQRLVLQPRLELDAYGKDDPERGVGSGLSGIGAALRLRHEIRREFAPYVGIEHSRTFGRSADFARAAGRPVTETRWVAGLRFWF